MRYVWESIHGVELDMFKRSWPCHGLPDALTEVHVEFAPNGDLIDIECHDADGNILDSAEFDGPAMVAIVGDIRSGQRFTQTGDSK